MATVTQMPSFKNNMLYICCSIMWVIGYTFLALYLKNDYALENLLLSQLPHLPSSPRKDLPLVLDYTVLDAGENESCNGVFFMVHLEAHALVKMKIYLILFLPLLGKFNYLFLSILFVYFYGTYMRNTFVHKGVAIGSVSLLKRVQKLSKRSLLIPCNWMSVLL